MPDATVMAYAAGGGLHVSVGAVAGTPLEVVQALRDALQAVTQLAIAAVPA